MTKLMTFSVMNGFGVVEFDTAVGLLRFFPPAFPSRIQALMFRLWIGKWRDNCMVDPPVDVQLAVAAGLKEFIELTGDGASLGMTPGELLNAFLISDSCTRALERIGGFEVATD